MWVTLMIRTHANPSLIEHAVSSKVCAMLHEVELHEGDASAAYLCSGLEVVLVGSKAADIEAAVGTPAHSLAPVQMASAALPSICCKHIFEHLHAFYIHSRPKGNIVRVVKRALTATLWTNRGGWSEKAILWYKYAIAFVHNVHRLPALA